VVNQLLTEMDGLEGKGRHVFVIGATNRPDIIDPAILRPGRLDKTLFVGFPSSADRIEILNAITKRGTRPPLGSDVSIAALASDARCEGLTGADLTALVREAAVASLKEGMGSKDFSRKRDCQGQAVEIQPPLSLSVCRRHFEVAFRRLKPSVSIKDRALYEEIKTKAMELN
jgi:ribosome biogenesis ATPase